MKKKKRAIKYDTPEQQERLLDFKFKNSWNQREVSKTFIEMLCARLLEFFDDPDTLTMEEFYSKEGIQETSFSRWAKKHEILADTYKHIRTLLTARREKGMIKGQYRDGPILRSLHCYSERWKDVNSYWSDLKKSEHGDEDKHTVVIIDKLKGEE